MVKALPFPEVCERPVVVGRGPVEVEVGRFFEELSAFDRERGEVAGERIECVGKVCAFNDKVRAGFGYLRGFISRTGKQFGNLVVPLVGSVQADLVEPERMARGQDPERFCERIGDREEEPAGQRDVKRQRNRGSPVRFYVRQRKLSSFDRLPVTRDLKGSRDKARRIREIPVIADHKEPRLRIVGGAERAVDIFVLEETRVGRPVRVDQAVQTEIAVMLELPVVAAVGVHGLAVRGGALTDRVVAPLPDKTAAKARVCFREVPVLLKITRAVAHGVAVLDEKEGLFGVIFEVVRDLPECRVHAAEEVDVRKVVGAVIRQVEGALVVGEAPGVGHFCPRKGLLEGAAVAAFISHGPDED